MRFYVAGKFREYRRCREMIDFLTSLGHSVTYDWTRTEEFNEEGDPKGPVGERGDIPRWKLQLYAENDIEGVLDSDFIVVLADSQLCGAWIELGAALASPKFIKCYVLSAERWTIFLHHPKVVQYSIMDFSRIAPLGL